MPDVRLRPHLPSAVAVALAGTALASFAAGGAAGATTPAAPAPYARLAPPLTTPWTAAVSTVAPWPQYPRPQLERRRWLSLNGRWQYQQGTTGQKPPFGQVLSQTILVPFPVESALSGIERQDEWGWYRRTFTVPSVWRGDRVILNFGAVAWRASAYVNGRLAGIHQGDFDAFSLDITPLLRRRGENELVVGFYDPVGAAGEPVGKQMPGAPSGIRHTAVSGIWQTVWLEPVPTIHITGLELTPDLAHGDLVVAVSTPSAPAAARRGLTVSATALAGRRPLTTATAPPGARLLLRIPRPHEWWPWRPYLYGLRVELSRSRHVIDQVTSYFGMRSITVGRVGGAKRILLNGRFEFETGGLDQGYWPDGLYTPPTDTAIRFDIGAVKRLGFDMLREHEKVQPDRWYYWADREGILVWQDMPSLPRAEQHHPSAASQAEFRSELARIVAQHRSDPSIVVWVPFNEGWGEFDQRRITDEVRRLDPAALVDTDSGSANCCAAPAAPFSAVRDTHLYAGPFAAPADWRASAVGEYGGILPYPPTADRWPGPLTSVGHPAVSWAVPVAERFFRAQNAALAEEMRARGLSAAVFTEFADCEQEVGILSYDRRVFTMSPDLLHGLNRQLIKASERPAELEPQAGAMPPGPSGSWSFSEGSGEMAGDDARHPDPLRLGPGVGWTQGPRLLGGRSRAIVIRQSGEAAMSANSVIDSARSFTVSAWLRPDAPGESGTAVSEPGPDGSSFSLGIETSPSPRGMATRWTFTVPAAANCTPAMCGIRVNTGYDDGRYPARVGRWDQVTAVYDQGTDSMALYVDGIPQDLEPVLAVPPARGPLTVGEGSDDYEPTDAFIGAISRLRTWARALSPAQVWELYRADTG